MMADILDKDLVGIVGSIFATSPEAMKIARERADLNRAQAVAQAEAQQMGGGTALSANIMGGQAVRQLGGLLGTEDPMMQRESAKRQLAQGLDMSSPESVMEYANRLNNAGMQQEAAQAMLAARAMQEQQQRISTSRAQQIRAEREPGQVNFQQLLSSGKYTPASVAKFQQSQNPADLVLTKGVEGEGGIGKLTPAQKAADMAFGKEYNDFVAGGGIATIQKNLQDLDNAIATLEKSKDGEITGKLIGLSDKAGTLSFTNPKAAEIKDVVGGVVQSNLRAVLGGQFAQKEGEALLARAFNPSQPQKDNLNRLKALREQISNAANAKIQAVGEFEEKGTLKEFKPGAFRQSATAITAPGVKNTGNEIDFNNLPKRK